MVELPLEMQVMLAEMAVAQHDRIRASAAREPERFKLTTVFPRDGSASYRYWESKAGPRMRTVRFCYSSHRNAAGYFLTWRERDLGKGVWKRDQWAARKVRRAAREMALGRYRALEKQRGRTRSALT